MQAAIKAQTLEINVAAQETIGDIEILRNKLVNRIEVYKAGELTKTLLGKNTATDAAFNAAYLELRQKGTNVPFNGIPFVRLNPSSNNGKGFELAPKVYDWVNSKIVCNDPTAVAANTDNRFVLVVYYQDRGPAQH